MASGATLHTALRRPTFDGGRRTSHDYDYGWLAPGGELSRTGDDGRWPLRGRGHSRQKTRSENSIAVRTGEIERVSEPQPASAHARIHAASLQPASSLSCFPFFAASGRVYVFNGLKGWQRFAQSSCCKDWLETRHSRRLAYAMWQQREREGESAPRTLSRNRAAYR